MFLPKVEMSGGNERSACQLGVVYNEKSLSEMKGDLVMLEGSLILYRVMLLRHGRRLIEKISIGISEKSNIVFSR